MVVLFLYYILTYISYVILINSYWIKSYINFVDLLFNEVGNVYHPLP